MWSHTDIQDFAYESPQWLQSKPKKLGNPGCGIEEEASFVL